jgi:hypothetical protein
MSRSWADSTAEHYHVSVKSPNFEGASCTDEVEAVFKIPWAEKIRPA